MNILTNVYQQYVDVVGHLFLLEREKILFLLFKTQSTGRTEFFVSKVGHKTGQILCGPLSVFYLSTKLCTFLFRKSWAVNPSFEIILFGKIGACRVGARV